MYEPIYRPRQHSHFLPDDSSNTILEVNSEIQQSVMINQITGANAWICLMSRAWQLTRISKDSFQYYAFSGASIVVLHWLETDCCQWIHWITYVTNLLSKQHTITVWDSEGGSTKYTMVHLIFKTYLKEAWLLAVNDLLSVWLFFCMVKDNDKANFQIKTKKLLPRRQPATQGLVDSQKKRWFGLDFCFLFTVKK